MNTHSTNISHHTDGSARLRMQRRRRCAELKLLYHTARSVMVVGKF
jgi:hypothetical protein